ncbi:MAG TPA: amidohydrolase family protein [Bryobacteraceae bacterium]|nr:amidohydrolase family protein [Bryobacteraceae bacterium]
MMVRCGVVPVLLLFLAACSRPNREPVDAAIQAEVNRIRAIDNHAHPARTVRNGPPDRDFDALPVDNLEPASDPLRLRPGAPLFAEAAHSLFGEPSRKSQIQREKGDSYPAWVLDQIGVDTMLANRVALGPGIQPPRFRWIAYIDALMFPLDNTQLAARNSDRKAFFALEDRLRARYLAESGLDHPLATLASYLARVVTPALERHKQGGALAEKFEAAYLRSLQFDAVDRAAADRIYAQFIGKSTPSEAEYKPLQDYLFHYIAAECGRLGMAVHLHTGEGGGSYFDMTGANPMRLESVLNDPSLRKTRFVMLHGGWPFDRQIAALLEKPNAYLDFSFQDLARPPAALAATLREWLAWVPEKILFGTDAYPYSDQIGWEESGWVAAHNARQALAIALTGMMRDGEISRDRAFELARLVLRENARKLYGL